MICRYNADYIAAGDTYPFTHVEENCVCNVRNAIIQLTIHQPTACIAAHQQEAAPCFRGHQVLPIQGDGVHARQSGPFNLEDDPVSKNLQIENGVCSDGYEIVIEHTEEVSSTEATNPHIDALSMEKTVAMLAKMKNLLDSGRFDAKVYEHMTLDAVKDYLSTMTDSAQLIFVSYEIQDSDLGPFLTQDNDRYVANVRDGCHCPAIGSSFSQGHTMRLPEVPSGCDFRTPGSAVQEKYSTHSKA